MIYFIRMCICLCMCVQHLCTHICTSSAPRYRKCWYTFNGCVQTKLPAHTSVQTKLLHVPLFKQSYCTYLSSNKVSCTHLCSNKVTCTYLCSKLPAHTSVQSYLHIPLFKQSYLHIPLLSYSVHITNFSWKKIMCLAFEWPFVFGCNLNNYASKNVYCPTCNTTACNMSCMCMSYSVIWKNVQNRLLWFSYFYLIDTKMFIICVDRYIDRWMDEWMDG
jgi:hypothetical protein